MPTRHDDDLLRPVDVAAQYHIGANRVRELVREGHLRALRIGPRILIPRWVIRDYVRDHLTVPTVTEVIPDGKSFRAMTNARSF